MPASTVVYIGVNAYSAFQNVTLTAYAGNYSVLNDYPFTNYSCGTASSMGFIVRNCTDWVGYRANVSRGIVASPWWFTNSLTGTGTPDPNCTDAVGARLSDACYWANRLQNSRLAMVDSSPTVGSIAHWSAQGTGSRSHGHVAWVEAVNSDGTVTVSEFNYSTACGFGVREHVRADRYIHLN